jgi:hypothetical protein
MDGFGTATVWLSPGVPRLVAPSGMPEPALDPAVEIVSCPLEPCVADADELPEFAELHPEEPDIPPPSNDPLELVLGHGIVSGLIPVGVSSVAPMGMLDVDTLDCSEAVVPSGEVAPMPDVDAVCAWTVVSPIQISAARMQVLRIDVSRTVRHGSQRQAGPPTACGPLRIRQPPPQQPVGIARVPSPHRHRSRRTMRSSPPGGQSTMRFPSILQAVFRIAAYLHDGEIRAAANENFMRGRGFVYDL